jgi:hypothetical protein
MDHATYREVVLGSQNHPEPIGEGRMGVGEQ